MIRLTTFLSTTILLLSLIACAPEKTKTEHSVKEIPTKATKKLKALIIDGENNHGVFPLTTMLMRDYLLATNLFSVDHARTAYTWQGPHYDQDQTRFDF